MFNRITLPQTRCHTSQPNSMALKFHFPGEIIVKILDQVPVKYVRYFHDKLPEDDPLQKFLFQRLYKRVVLEGNDILNESTIKYTELESLIQQNFLIQYLEFGQGDAIWLLDVCPKYPNYFSKIPSISYSGSDLEFFLHFASYCLMDNLVAFLVNLSYLDDPLGSFRPTLNKFPSSLTKMSIQLPSEGIAHESRLKLPTSLKSISLSGSMVSDFILPNTLEELECVECAWSTPIEFPQSLKKLIFLNAKYGLDEYPLPEGLEELAFTRCHGNNAEEKSLSLPKNLKKLCFVYCDLSDFRIPLDFPDSDEWRRTFLRGRDIQRLEELKPVEEVFPAEKFELPASLTWLALHGCKVDSAHVAKFPAALKHLDFCCATWEGSSLPQDLREMNIVTEQHTTQFPPNLEELEYSLSNEDRQDLNFQLPPTLRKLTIKCINECTFELNPPFPELEYTKMENCCGPVALTEKLVLNDIPSICEGFVVPFGVRELKTSCPLMDYPDSILDLEIYGFDSLTSPPLPENLRYLTLHSPLLSDIHEIKIPRSVYKISGFNSLQAQVIESRARDGILYINGG